MANTIYTDSQGQAASKGGGSSSKWGRLLFTVETDRKRIGLEILIRVAVSVFAVFLTYSRGKGLIAAPTLVLFALFSAWPLLHMGDQMELYQNGIAYKGELYAIGVNTRIVWENRRGCFLPITWLNVSGATRRINVSFMKDAGKLFNRAYNNAIYEKGE